MASTGSTPIPISVDDLVYQNSAEMNNRPGHALDGRAVAKNKKCAMLPDETLVGKTIQNCPGVAVTSVAERGMSDRDDNDFSLFQFNENRARSVQMLFDYTGKVIHDPRATVENADLRRHSSSRHTSKTYTVSDEPLVTPSRSRKNKTLLDEPLLASPDPSMVPASTETFTGFREEISFTSEARMVEPMSKRSPILSRLLATVAFDSLHPPISGESENSTADRHTHHCLQSSVGVRRAEQLSTRSTDIGSMVATGAFDLSITDETKNIFVNDSSSRYFPPLEQLRDDHLYFTLAYPGTPTILDTPSSHPSSSYNELAITKEGTCTKPRVASTFSQIVRHSTSYNSDEVDEAEEDRRIEELLSRVQRTKKPCKCTKSRCLKLYCECFHKGLLCDAKICICVKCKNKERYCVIDGIRTKAMKSILARRPGAFGTTSRKLRKVGGGCACKKNRCLKLYCDCLSLNVKCTASCRCNDCHNRPNIPATSPKKVESTVPLQRLKDAGIGPRDLCNVEEV